jgi:hypothetical protein
VEAVAVAAAFMAVGAGVAAEAALRFAGAVEERDLAAADFMAAADDLEAAVWLDARHRWGAQAVVEVGRRSTFRVAVVRVWGDFRRRALVEVDGLAVGKLRDQAAVAGQAVDKSHDLVAAVVPVAGRLHDQAAVRDLAEAASPADAPRRATSITS